MTIKELKEKFPQEEYEWIGLRQNGGPDYSDDDIVLTMSFAYNTVSFTYRKVIPVPKTLSKAKLDRVIDCNRIYFKTPIGTYERDYAIDKLNKAEEDCGEIKETGLLDIISTITLSTKNHNAPNETIYKVFEDLGYKLVD